MSRTFLSVFAALLLAATPLRAQNCGDCTGDMQATILDALQAAQNAVGLVTLMTPNFEQCNVVGDLGGPGSPGNPVVDILDALAIAQFSAGLIGAPTCQLGPVMSSGPFDVVFLNAPTQTASATPFEVTIGLYVQGTTQPAIPTTPLLVTLRRFFGGGTLTGSLSQWMTSESKVFGNLRYDLTESFLLEASAGPPHGTDTTGLIANRLGVFADLRSSTVTGGGPYPPVRFYFRVNETNRPLSGVTFGWEIVEDSTGSVVATSSVALSGQMFVDVPVASLPGNGLYRVTGEVIGTPARDNHALIRGASDSLYIATLSTGRVDTPYADAITNYVPGSFSNFLVIAEDLPPGLSLTPGSAGTISGTPTTPGYFEFTAVGVDGGFNVTRVPVGLAVFSYRDTEIEAGIDFSSTGPYSVSEFDFPSSFGNYTFLNTWRCQNDTTRARFYYPSNIRDLGRVPAIAFIHGNGFDWDDYDNIMRVIASYGYVIGSCNNPGYPGGNCIQCGGGSSSAGWGRATGFQNSVREKFLEFDADPMSPLFERIDIDNIIWSGHSRGGSTTQVNNQIAADVARGAIPIMPVDPKADGCLGLANALPPVPTLSFSAEKDGDVIFPIAENPMEDAVLSGLDTHVTVYGSIHNYTGDSNGAEWGASPTISRAQQQQRIRHWITLFMQRHTRGDLRVEGQLYLGEQTSSSLYAVFGRRGFNNSVVVDDHQATGTGTNSLGGQNSSGTVSVTETNTHPSGYQYGRTVSHRRLGFGSGSGSNTWSAPMGAPVDTSTLAHLSFRARQYNSTTAGGVGTGNWQSWLSNWTVTLQDGAGTTSTIDLRPSFPVSSTPSPSQQRFHRFSISLEDFVASNPSFDASSIQSVRFDLGPAGTSSRLVGIDDLRFE